MSEGFEIRVESEIGRLTGVLLHRPGQEIANMTPETAQRALYSDILNLAVAAEEYEQLHGVLAKWTRVFQVRDLLADILGNNRVRDGLVRRICEAEGVADLAADLVQLEAPELARVLIEGLPLVHDNLSRFLSRDRFSLPPLHNFFFTRDSAVVVRDKVMISRMANPVRGRETRIMEAIFDYHPGFGARTVNPARLGAGGPEITIEGGDVLVAAEDVLLVGVGARTTAKAVDFLIERVKELGLDQHLIVQLLPETPESFIHLDMVFTLLDRDACLIYEPVIRQTHHFDTVHIHVRDGQVQFIREEDTLLTALASVGLDLKPISCGSPDDRWLQEREQWHSGANFFALAPGKVIGYGRNVNTINELSDNGFQVVTAREVIAGDFDLASEGRCVITIDGSELARGGGGCRCMTMPLGREKLI